MTSAKNIQFQKAKVLPKWSNGVMEERPALLIIDMVKDNLDESKPVPIYRKNVLYPLFRIMPSEQLLEELR